MISIIIPAHNEASVIQRCLTAMTTGALPGELQILVVCNGCTDHTADLARDFHPSVRVLETPLPSKSHALNLGDAAAGSFPRFYVDADVVLPLESIRRLASHLNQNLSLAAAPRPSFDLDGCTWPVRDFYFINTRLPSASEGIGGSGVYALSHAGRLRFTAFPPITADDGFIRLQFQTHERATLSDCHSIVYAPRTLRDLIAIKTRSHFGTRQLRLFAPSLWSNVGPGNARALLRLSAHLTLWPALAVYCFVKFAARCRALRQLRQSHPPAWERDNTSRPLPAPEKACLHVPNTNAPPSSKPRMYIRG